LNGKGKKGSITTSNPGGSIRRSEQGFDLGLVQEIYWPFLMPFAGHRQYSLTLVSVGGIAQGDEAEERVNRCQTSVSRTGAISPFCLKVMKELTDEGGVQRV
jgi:hypothetical protein